MLTATDIKRAGHSVGLWPGDPDGCIRFRPPVKLQVADEYPKLPDVGHYVDAHLLRETDAGAVVFVEGVKDLWFDVTYFALPR